MILTQAEVSPARFKHSILVTGPELERASEGAARPKPASPSSIQMKDGGAAPTAIALMCSTCPSNNFAQRSNDKLPNSQV